MVIVTFFANKLAVAIVVEVAMKSSKSSEKVMMLLLKSNDSTYFLGEVAVMLTFGRVVAITS